MLLYLSQVQAAVLRKCGVVFLIKLYKAKEGN